MLTSLKNRIKKGVLATAPEWLLHPARKLHYAKVIKSISGDSLPEFRLLKSLIKPGDVVIDLGAHIGIHTKFFSGLVGETGKVFSVEPYPTTYDILKSNVEKLKLANITLMNLAVSDHEAELMMEVPIFRQLGESYYDAHIVTGEPNPNFKHARVRVNTIDRLFSSLADPTFIKCDVEGQELQAILGAHETIAKCCPAWSIEISLMDSVTHQTIRDLLMYAGYEEFWFTSDFLTKWTLRDRPIDTYFLQPKHLNQVKALIRV